MTALIKVMADLLLKRRILHTKRRIRQFKCIVPEIRDDILDSCSLRQLSYLIRKCGKSQLTLKQYFEIEPIVQNISFTSDSLSTCVYDNH